jgi:hypothetical protein
LARDVHPVRVPSSRRVLEAIALPPALLACLGLAIMLAPILYFRYPLIVDFPNHLARLYILSAPADSFLSRMYSVSWSLYTNVGIDLSYRAMQRIADRSAC